MILQIKKGRSRRAESGFTLTELAIVLGIVGLVLGGIWVAAAAVYTSLKTRQIMDEFVYASNNLHIFNTMNITSAGDESLTDTCGAVPPCSTNLLLEAGVFKEDFIIPNGYASGAAYGVGTLYQTSLGYTIWTGIENGEIYANQAGSCPSSGCPSAPTVIEIDLFGLSTDVCVNLLTAMVNAHIDNLYSISTTTYGWGPMTTAYGGTPAMPATMPPSLAAQACMPGTGSYGYDTSSQSQIWVWFVPNSI